MPPTFSQADLRALAESSDPRLAQAARIASDGKATQFIAGAPELLTRYHTASPVTKALITAAMDARRLGMGEAIPVSFLSAAAPAYLDDEDLVAIETEEWDDWLEGALAEVAKPAKGIRGPLTRIRAKENAASSGISYRLADCLDQYGRLERCFEIPGKEFWAACETLTDPGELRKLGSDAEARGLLFRAARLFKRGVMYGDAQSAQNLIWCLKRVFPDARNPSGMSPNTSILTTHGRWLFSCLC